MRYYDTPALELGIKNAKRGVEYFTRLNREKYFPLIDLNMQRVLYFSAQLKKKARSNFNYF